MIKRKSLFAAAVIAAGLAFATSGADANTFSPQDVQKISNLVEKTLNLMGDMVETGKHSRSDVRECLAGLNDRLNIVYPNLFELVKLIQISTMMVNSKDESIVKQQIDLSLKSNLEFVRVSRQSVNAITGICGMVAIVTTKAQSILYLLTEIESTLRALPRLS